MFNIAIEPEFFARYDHRVRLIVDAFRRQIDNIPGIRVSSISYHHPGRWLWGFFWESPSDRDGQFSVDIEYYPVVLNQLIGVDSPLLVFPDDAGYIPEGVSHCLQVATGFCPWESEDPIPDFELDRMYRLKASVGLNPGDIQNSAELDTELLERLALLESQIDAGAMEFRQWLFQTGLAHESSNTQAN